MDRSKFNWFIDTKVGTLVTTFAIAYGVFLPQLLSPFIWSLHRRGQLIGWQDVYSEVSDHTVTPSGECFLPGIKYCYGELCLTQTLPMMCLTSEDETLNRIRSVYPTASPIPTIFHPDGLLLDNRGEVRDYKKEIRGRFYLSVGSWAALTVSILVWWYAFVWKSPS